MPIIKSKHLRQTLWYMARHSNPGGDDISPSHSDRTQKKAALSACSFGSLRNRDPIFAI